MPQEVKDSNIMLIKNYYKHTFNVWSKYNFIYITLFCTFTGFAICIILGIWIISNTLYSNCSNLPAGFDMNVIFTAFLIEAKYFYIPWKKKIPMEQYHVRILYIIFNKILIVVLEWSRKVGLHNSSR